MQPPLCLSLEPHPASPAIARDHARDFVGTWVRADVVDDLSLLVTEVVANAIRHAGSDIRLEMSMSPAVVRVEVFDGSSELPVLRHPVPTSDSGRGLRLVDALATRWGSRRQLDGKVVWFELRLLLAATPLT
jgi:anti-sigma regulatory factor (Ser/Thr protein kinase)